MVGIAVLGHGVVGSGVVEILLKNKDLIKARSGADVIVKKILDILDFNSLSYSGIFTKEFSDVLSDKSISIVVETIGGLNPSYSYVKHCLEAGKSVVSSNKELVAEKGYELLELAKQNGSSFLFEASVGGGVPILRPLQTCLAANNINSIEGILNGTTNFILTKMFREGFSFEESLKLAKSLGYAESNPAADIEGLDSVRKICILSSVAFGKVVRPEEVYVEGIDAVCVEDVEFAASIGCVIKLVAKAELKSEGFVSVVVCPMLLPSSNKLCAVDGVLNGISIKGDAVGEVLFIGPGAGKLATASAVISDIIDIVRYGSKSMPYMLFNSSNLKILDFKENSFSFYFRLRVQDIDCLKEVKNYICRSFSVPVFLERENKPELELAFKTDCMLEGDILNFEEGLKEFNVRRESKIRIATC